MASNTLRATLRYDDLLLSVDRRLVDGGVVRPTLVLNPRSDESFVSLAERLVHGGVSSPETLQALLRERYASAVVRPREISSEPWLVWYVYRDGRWVSPDSKSKA